MLRIKSSNSDYYCVTVANSLISVSPKGCNDISTCRKSKVTLFSNLNCNGLFFLSKLNCSGHFFKLAT